MMANSSNMGEYWRNTAQVSATGYHASEEQNVALDLLLRGDIHINGSKNQLIFLIFIRVHKYSKVKLRSVR